MAKNPLNGIRAKRVVITLHSLADLDAVGAAIAVQRHLGKKALIALADKPTAAARRLLSYTGTGTVQFPALSRERGDFIIVLDSSSLRLLPQLSGITPDLAIDHHARTGGEIASKKLINDPAASSTCEMLYFMLKPQDRISCIAFLLGMISDSANFSYATPRTFEAASGMLSGCGLSYSSLRMLSHSPESLSERMDALRSCQSVSAERIGEHIIALAMAKSHEAHIADSLVHLGADLAFVGCVSEEGRVSARMRESLRGKAGLERIMAEAGKVMNGSGSGHELAAGATGEKGSVRDALAVCKKLAEQDIMHSEKARIKKIEW